MGQVPLYTARLGHSPATLDSSLLSLYEPYPEQASSSQMEGRYEAIWNREFIISWSKAGPLKSSH